MTVTGLPNKRWNFRKADGQNIKECTSNLPPDLPDPATSKVNTSYSAFCSMLQQAAKQSIPRGKRSPYIPCWDEDCELPYQAYVAARTVEEREAAGNNLLKLLGDKRRARWEEVVSDINFTHSSRKAWSTINKLTGRSSAPKQCPVSADSIASVLVKNGKWHDNSPEAKYHTHSVNARINKLLATTPQSSLKPSLLKNSKMPSTP